MFIQKITETVSSLISSNIIREIHTITNEWKILLK